MRIPDQLRAAYQSLDEAEGDQPGHDYDRGYLTGWYDVRRGHRKRVNPRGLYRETARVAEFQLGYVHGREDGAGRDVDWWPDYARGSAAAGASGLRERPVSSPVPKLTPAVVSSATPTFTGSFGL